MGRVFRRPYSTFPVLAIPEIALDHSNAVLSMDVLNHNAVTLHLSFFLRFLSLAPVLTHFGRR